MSRLNSVSIEQATGHTADLYSAIKSQLGGVPNIFLSLGSSPKVLETYLGMGSALDSLSGSEKESIALVVAQTNACEYCLAAHTLLGKKSGLSDGEVIAARKGGAGHLKKDALVKLAQEIVTKKGNISDQAFNNFLAAGYKESQVSEVVLCVAQNIFTNYFNHVNKTEIDFPAAVKI